MIGTINDLLWGKILLVVLIGLGVWFTFFSGFVQFRYFTRMFGVLGSALQHQKGHVSSFQALVLSVAGRVGAGNIAGVAVAITLGGPGALFWMWVVGIIGMATSFFECTLAQLYKKAEPDGTYRGGPAYYMERGLKKRWMGILYSILMLVSVGFAFTALQSYTVASSFEATFGVPTYITGIVMALIIGVIIFGGVKRIAEVAEWIVPFMAVGYFIMGIVVIGMNISEVPGVFVLIFKSAFGLEPAIGGGMGAAILMGVKRGLFSNEAGMGTAPNVAAVAYVHHPASQGIVQAFSVFIDTMILCTVTGMIILLSGIYGAGGELGGGVALTQNSLAEHVGSWGGMFVTIALLMFAFTSLLYNYYLGENSLNFFSEENKLLFNIFRGVLVATVIWGSMQDLGTIFAFADVAMGLLALGNLITLALLFKVGMRVLRDYDEQVKQGIEHPRFDAKKFADLDIDPEAWKFDSDRKQTEVSSSAVQAESRA